MILINDEDDPLLTDSENIYEKLTARSVKLREIMDDESATQQRRDWAYDEFVGYREELQDLNDLLKIPFDVLLVIEKEE